MKVAERKQVKKEELREMLLSLREETLKKIEEEVGTKVREDPRFTTLSTMDVGDLSQFDLDSDINYSLLQSHLQRLKSIDEALRRLEDGTYGYCEECGRAIDVKRLRVLPFARYCVQCQEKLEKVGKQKVRMLYRFEDMEADEDEELS
ncbi:MAG: transcriptional regulator, TraR/DksA family protein [Deltaproteobacteria bacterium]|nr:MAG: transcriptional regulator, TraR/DksA family protein [Deltaproteobacteria bacterium]